MDRAGTVTEPPGLRLVLRGYQEEALDRIAAAEERGVRKQLGVAATGLGKTVIFCALAERRRDRTLVLVHRDELVRQAVAKMREVWPGAEVGIVKAGDDDVEADVVVASVQTLSRDRRLDRLMDAIGNPMRLNPVEPFDLVVVDEAHHTAADTYRKVLDRLHAGEEGGPLLLGVTATPDRGDGKGLDDLFDEITWTYDILWGINAGFLCDIRAKRIVLDKLDLSDVKVRRGDYEAGAAGEALHDAEAALFIVKAWREHASDRQTLVFTPTVEFAHEVADEYRHHGVVARALSGATPQDERRAMLADYAEGRIQVIANCAVLTEGYDNPRTDCIVVARPTKSRALFTQMIGRGTRKHPDKSDLLVLDVVGASHEHSLVTVPSLFGFPVKEWPGLGDGKQNLTDAVAEFTRVQVLAGKMRAEDADLFNKMRSEGVAWVKLHTGTEPPRYQRTCGYRDADGKYVTLPTVVLTRRGDTEETWLAGVVEPDGRKRVLIADVSLELAQGVGEDYVRKTMGPIAPKLIDANAAWRKKRPSPKAKEAAAKWKMPDIGSYKTAGELSDALDAHIARVKDQQRQRREPANVE